MIGFYQFTPETTFKTATELWADLHHFMVEHPNVQLQYESNPMTRQVGFRTLDNNRAWGCSITALKCGPTEFQELVRGALFMSGDGAVTCTEP